jgi:hypothetical protein
MLSQVPGRRRGWVLSGYDKAQVCLHGHVINWFAESRQERNQDHCTRCGTSTITACPHCNEEIRGYLHTPGVSRLVPDGAPSFCHKCGHAHPWTQERLDTARELLYHDDKLTIEERNKLWDLLQYVMSDPKSDLVPAKRKLIEFNVVKAAAATREFVLDLMAKYAKEMSQP